MNRRDWNQNLAKGALCLLGVLGTGVIAFLAKPTQTLAIIGLSDVMMVFVLGAQLYWRSL